MQQKKSHQKSECETWLRLPLIDILRGLALCGMLIYHISWDLAYFGFFIPKDGAMKGLVLLARFVAFGFLFLAGFSLVLAHGTGTYKTGIRWHQFWRRFLLLCLIASLISAVTWIMIPEEFIYFGMIHEIALSSLVGLLFLRTPILLNLLVIAVVMIVSFTGPSLIGPLIMDSGCWWLGLVLGLTENVRSSFDYVPFFPWFAASLAGLTVARICIVQKKLYWFSYRIYPVFFSHILQWAGRNSLIIYLLHQPILFGILLILQKYLDQ